MKKQKNFELDEQNLRDSLVEQAKIAISLRNKEREFHGVEREFRYHQAQMIIDYEKTKDLKHPRDKGTSREVLLRNFLEKSGFLPKKYAISDRSIRVASTSGHISKEIDIALYDSNEMISLMNRQDIYEVYPVESVYGVIQVKSNLTKKELKSGLDNIRSFKQLKNNNGESKGFGILFAYCSDMKWEEIIKELKDFAKLNSRAYLPNLVFILGRGYFRWGDGNLKVLCLNEDIEKISEITVYGFPDREQMSLYEFHNLLLTMLRSTKVYGASLYQYHSLPFTSGEFSYKFTYGPFSEIYKCTEHGTFTKKIPPEAVEKIYSYCIKTKPINAVRAVHIAYNLPLNEEAYIRQPGVVFIYNPEELDLKEILVREGDLNGKKLNVISYEMIEINEIFIWLPYYYILKENLMIFCPKCNLTINSV
ncbi:DUF6602 domain-containing protein [Acinetobacter pittii]|uniref:DUF6602 domain-containing protein n=1 Tax=Acinetobacter pittii TaxID=48296 RepID=UPI003008DA61